MADFKTHLFVSSMLGLGYGAAGHVYMEAPMATSLLAGGLCSVAGMLPDIDSNSARPLKESLAFGAAVVPMMVGEHLKLMGATNEAVVLAGAILYLAVRFGVGWLLRHFTVHRGMFHSIPAALLFGELTFLLSTGPPLMRLFKGGAIVAGYLSHLLLDEFYSFDAKGLRLRVKKSLGTALKFYSPKSLGATFLTYAVLGLLTYSIVKQPDWMHDFHDRQQQKFEEQANQRNSPETETNPLQSAWEEAMRIVPGTERK